ncbi:MAG: 3'-5' exonuclease [Candidatus Veblenbacteria bacterium]|nr:3'-5' exonuclease [Candidatus Veblenbacteria bacterium]
MSVVGAEYVIFDVETTGIRPEEGHAVVELAAQRVRERQVVDTFSSIVNPGRSIEPEAVAVHGITNELVAREGKSFVEVLPAFVLFSAGATLVAHNIKFDLSFVNHHLKQLGLPALANPMLDTIELAKQKVAVASYSLTYLARHFGIPQPQAHRALADVEVTRELLFKLLDLPPAASLKK